MTVQDLLDVLDTIEDKNTSIRLSTYNWNHKCWEDCGATSATICDIEIFDVEKDDLVPWEGLVIEG